MKLFLMCFDDIMGHTSTGISLDKPMSRLSWDILKSKGDTSGYRVGHPLSPSPGWQCWATGCEKKTDAKWSLIKQGSNSNPVWSRLVCYNHSSCSYYNILTTLSQCARINSCITVFNIKTIFWLEGTRGHPPLQLSPSQKFVLACCAANPTMNGILWNGILYSTRVLISKLRMESLVQQESSFWQAKVGILYHSSLDCYVAP